VLFLLFLHNLQIFVHIFLCYMLEDMIKNVNSFNQIKNKIHSNDT